MKKLLSSFMAVMLLLFLVGCDTNVLNPLEDATQDSKTADDGKSTRGGWIKIGGDLNTNGTLNNAQAIAAYGDVWVASSNGGLYLCYAGGDSFRPLYVSAPSTVIDMAAGPERYVGVGSGGTGSVYHKGVYVLTADGKTYGLFYSKGRFWLEDEGMAPAKSIAVNKNGALFCLGQDNMIHRKLNGGKMTLGYYAPFTIKKITAGNINDLNVVLLNEANQAYHLWYSTSTGSYNLDAVSTGGYSLTNDIEMGKNPSHGIWDYAFFSSWNGSTGNVVFKPHSGNFASAGGCRMISVDGNVLWDAWTSGIYKREM